MTRLISHAVIMAAGRGRRLMPLTAEIPKAMAPYANSTLIGHGIRRIRRYVPNVHVTVGYMASKVAPHLIEENVSTIVNTEGRGNCWWIYNTLLSNLNEPIFVLTCDNITDINFDELEADYLAKGCPTGMIVPVRPVPGLEGDYIFQEAGRVIGIDRHTPSESYCSGIQILVPAEVKKLTTEAEDFYGVWRQLIECGDLYCSDVFPARWFTVDTMSDLSRLADERQ